MQIDKTKLKNLAVTFGKLLGVAGILFVFYVLFQKYSFSELLARFDRFKWLFIPMVLFNMFSHFTGIYAWHRVVLNYRQKPFPYLFSYYYFAKTEIAKYLPGNIFHLVGRQALASKIGLTQKQMAKISLFVTSSLLLSTLIATAVLAVASGMIEAWLLAALFGALAVAAIIYVKTFPSLSPLEKLRISFFQALSILIQGILIAWIIALQMPMNISLFLAVAAIYIVSWLVGFVTPGASGGVGVREGAFLAIAAFVHLEIPTDIVVFSVLLIRLVNIAADILMYLSAIPLQKRVEADAEHEET